MGSATRCSMRARQPMRQWASRQAEGSARSGRRPPRSADFGSFGEQKRPPARLSVSLSQRLECRARRNLVRVRALVDVLPGAIFPVVIAPVVTRSERRSSLHRVTGPVVLRALHRAVARDGVSGLVSLGHKRLLALGVLGSLWDERPTRASRVPHCPANSAYRRTTWIGRAPRVSQSSRP